MSLVYLKWSFLLLVVWGGVLYASDAAGRRSLLTPSLGTVPFSLTEPLFVPSYWNPPTLFDLARRKVKANPLGILQRRYAAGEITTQEYEERKKRLELHGAKR